MRTRTSQDITSTIFACMIIYSQSVLANGIVGITLSLGICIYLESNHSRQKQNKWRSKPLFMTNFYDHRPKKPSSGDQPWQLTNKYLCKLAALLLKIQDEFALNPSLDLVGGLFRPPSNTSVYTLCSHCSTLKKDTFEKNRYFWLW